MIFVGLSSLLLEPVENAAYEGRNEEQLAVSTGYSLNLVEDQCHIALDLALEQDLSSFDALPSRRDLYQDSVRVNSRLFVKCDDPFATLDCFILVKR